jgi:hypothetical protein
MCLMTLYALQASGINKGLAALAMHLGSHVSKVRLHVSKAAMPEQLRPTRRAGRRHH